MRDKLSSRWLAMRGVCCAVLLCGVAVAAKKPLTAWDSAVAMRAGFDPDSATRAEWTRMMDSYRLVYHDNPADLHAPDAVNAVAELLADEGRVLGDAKLSRAAIGQYEFLRTQYPKSRLRVQALVAEGRIEAELREAVGARRASTGTVKGVPNSDSRGADRGTDRGTDRGWPAGTGRDKASAPARGLALETRASETHPLEPHTSEAKHGAPAVEVIPTTGAPALLGDGNRQTYQNDNKEVALDEVKESSREVVSGVPGGHLKPSPSARLAEVTGIRHWSTPSYTRVAIDLGDEVTFEAARVPHPDRIYFDLHGARLAAELVGKSFDVTDNGFLRKIRAAQASADVTRVVLDVSDVTEYSAFLLPNPYRLIIDIHGGRKEPAASPLVDAAEVPVPLGAGRVASAAANTSGLPAMSVTDGGDAVRAPIIAGGSGRSLPQTITHPNRGTDAAPAPRTGVVARATAARPVPNTVAVKAPATTTEVAAVSAAPGRVEATTAPTSRPVVAVVKGGASSVVATPSHASEARRGAPGPGASVAEPGKAAKKTAEGETSLVRALGLKIGRIVIDAGHGGHDSGTLGVDGIQEKDVVLDVALRLGKLLHERLGAEIIYTRSDDTFIPLETRTAIANKAEADLFLSIHANSSQDETARGVETYYLNFTSDPTALDVAARENAVGGQGVHQLSDLVKKITLKDKIAESREFASDVEASLYAGLEKGNAGLKNRGVKKAPFVVLIGANMPSILAEISFVTNARDAGQLREPEYRQRVAESLFSGVAKYEGGLAGARPGPSVRVAVR